MLDVQSTVIGLLKQLIEGRQPDTVTWSALLK